MSLLTIKKKPLFMIVGISFFFIGTLLFYTFYMMPLQKKVHILKAELQTEKRMVNMVRKNDDKQNLGSKSNVATLLRQLPVEPLIDQFLLDIEKAEFASKSVITSIQLVDLNNSDPNEGNVQEQQTALNKHVGQQLPYGIQKITVQLTVESSSYEKLTQFIQTLDSLKRVTKIEQLSYTGYSEMNLHQNKTLSFKVTVSTFYFPKLKGLASQDPQIITPNPGGKTNPLVPVSGQK